MIREAKSKDAKAIATSFFAAAGEGQASPAASMNLFIPPYRPSPSPRNINSGNNPGNHNDGVSGGSISPYNPTSIAKSLTTGVNQRHLLYAKTARGVLLSWATTWTIVVGVPVVVAVLTA